MNEAVDALCVVDANAAKRSASPRTRDVGGTGHVGDQLPPVRGACVAQGSARGRRREWRRAAGPRCSALYDPPRRRPGRCGVGARRGPPGDRRGADAALLQLPPGNDTPLPLGRSADHPGQRNPLHPLDVDCVDLAMAASLGCPRCPFNTRLCRGCAGRLARALRGGPRERYVVTRAISSIEVTPARAFCRPSSRTVTMPWERATSEISDSGARCTVSDLISSLITITEKRPMRPR